MNEKYTQHYKEIGLKVAYYRKLKGLSQITLAEQIDVSRTHLSNIEAPNMPTSISLELLFKISEVLDVEVKNFFDFHHK
ncbi:MAG: helix-turn-helix transcriptional regulator [Lachnospiraceae bacterium]|nr:helix-turn-helix transcriptional regulator [Lachnospiraceae bacterium]